MQDQVMECGAKEILEDPAFPALCAEAATECANRELSGMALDEQFYRTLEKSGSMRCFAVRAWVNHSLDAPALIGFATVLLAPSGFNGKRYATVERLFVADAYRDGGVGLRLMAVIEDAAREAGCEAVVYSAHVGSRLARLMFLLCDKYTLTNLIFCRRLD